jgi:hypothetical protein
VSTAYQGGQRIETQVVVGFDEANTMALIEMLKEHRLEELALAAARAAPDGRVVALIARSEAKVRIAKERHRGPKHNVMP